MPKNQTDTPGYEFDSKGCQIHIRCTPDVKRELMTLAGGKGCLSDFMLSRARSNPQANGKANRKGLIEALGQLGKIGSNVNQLAKAYNSGHTVPDSAIMLALEEIERCGQAIRQALTQKDAS